MKKEIALYVNNLGEISDLNRVGFIRIFTKDNNKWNLEKEIEVNFNNVQEKENMGFHALKISEALGKCRIFVAKEIPNIIFTILNNIGLSIWKMEGDQYKILEYVLEKELEEDEEIKFINKLKIKKEKEMILPIEAGSNGYYIINLKDVQEHNIGITTKQVLKPFLLENKFNQLIITCSHIPCWLESELEGLNLNFETWKTGENDCILVINHNQ